VEDQVAAQRHGLERIQFICWLAPGYHSSPQPLAGKININGNPESLKPHASVYNEAGGFFDEFPAAIH
jgi:hypothetical protein